MARARNIKPGFFINEKLVELPFSTRLLFIGLWTVADSSGRLEDRPLKIKMAVFPADEVDVNLGLEELRMKGFITRYEIDGKRFIEVTNFVRHQKPHSNEPKSLILPPFKALAPMVEGLAPLDEALGSERGKRKEERGLLNEESPASPFARDDEPESVKLYRESFPDASFDLYRQNLIAARVTDIPRWRKTLAFWKGNGYRALSVDKMLDCYDNEGYERNGNNKTTVAGSRRSENDSQSTDDFLASIGANPAR